MGNIVAPKGKRARYATIEGNEGVKFTSYLVRKGGNTWKQAAKITFLELAMERKWINGEAEKRLKHCSADSRKTGVFVRSGGGVRIGW